jgi:hypothetical protein
MLHTNSHTTTTSYSKVLRGLRFPLEISGLCTRMVSSGDPNQGQWRSRYAIHASRHSIGKVLRYLKRIIVIPAVYQLLAPLKRSLKYWHWADVTTYTNHCWLADSYVFIKQSDLPSYCTLYSQLKNYKRRDPLCRRHRANLPISLD